MKGKKGKLIFSTFFFITLLVIYGNGGRLKEMSLSFSDFNISKKNLEKTVLDLQAFGERRSWVGQSKTSQYLHHRLKTLGLTPQLHVYSYNDKNWDNIWVTFPGAGKKNSQIIVMAHYDSTSRGNSTYAPGADDNASGVSLLLEIARFFQTETFNHDVQLVFLSNEEHGRSGSKAFVKKIKDEKTELTGVLNVDIVGYNNPNAIFSKEPLSIAVAELPLKRKVKMILKMVHNFGIQYVERGKTLKIAGRPQDTLLKPGKQDTLIKHLKEDIKWKFGDTCA